MDERDAMTPDGAPTDTGTPQASTGQPSPGGQAHEWKHPGVSGPEQPGPAAAESRPRTGLAGRYRALGRRGKLAFLVGAVAVVLGVVLSTVGSAAGRSHKVTTLPRAKNFTLSVLGHPGEHVSLSQYTGKPVILNFFASWCDPCQKETPLIAKFYADAHGSVTIIGIDVNDPTASALKFVHAKGVTYPVVADPAPMTTTISYGVSALPQTFFLNARHRIVKRIFGAVTIPQMRAGVALMHQQTK